jgi:hypothetical protein
MRMRVLFLSLVVWALSVVSAGAADATGRWRVTISANGSKLIGVAMLKQTGDEITRSIGVDARRRHRDKAPGDDGARRRSTPAGSHRTRATPPARVADSESS